MTTDTSTADKRGVEYMYIDYSTWLSRPILVGDKPNPYEVEYVRHDELKAMQARAEKAEAENERLRNELGMIAFSDLDAVEARAHARAALERKEVGA